MWDVVVIGGANTDYLIRGDTLPAAGTTRNGDVFLEGPGGKGANQAVAAARLGARTAFIGCVGEDARGRALVRTLTEERVDVSSVTATSAAPTGAAVIQVDSQGQKQILAALGANHRITVDGIAAAAGMIETSRVLLMQLEVPVDVVTKAAALAHAHGVRVVLDPAPPCELPDALLAHVDLIRGNATEIEFLSGIPITDRDSARRAGAALFAREVQTVVAEVGDEGNVLMWPSGEVWLPRLPVKHVDATGAGDDFSAALAVAVAE
jgi:ribokinase